MTKPNDPLLPGTSHAQFAYRWSAWLDDTKQASFGQTPSSLPASALAADSS